MFKKLCLLALGVGFTTLAQANDGGVQRQFSITGYYSPLPNQSYYVTGSYETDVRLNGEGIAGADGTPVFPGMIAAPYDYAYGTKICIPNWGCGSVHDRGGAIVNKGVRDVARHDRLDLWMGYGEEGLARALALGLWHTSGTIYPNSNTKTSAVSFKAVKPISQVVDLPTKVERHNDNLSAGFNGSKVKLLQEDLIKLGHLSAGLDTGKYGPATEAGVLDFQIKNSIVSKSGDFGAGNFGPTTRATLNEAVHQYEVTQKLRQRWDEAHFEKNIYKGARSEDVWTLQEFLIKKEYLDHQPTGYFGALTKESLIDFQLGAGLISSRNDTGAGNVGPKTREVLNQFIAQRKLEKQQEKERSIAYQDNRKQLRFLAGETPDNNLASR